MRVLKGTHVKHIIFCVSTATVSKKRTGQFDSMNTGQAIIRQDQAIFIEGIEHGHA